jgi:hypothetical protein
MSEDFPSILLEHAQSMHSEGFYTVANALDKAAAMLIGTPDLLAASKAILCAIEFEGENGSIRFNPGTPFEADELRNVRAAIAKATGQSA